MQRPFFWRKTQFERELSLRGPQARGNLLRHCTNPHCLPGDCHVGLRPPRNDVVIFTWSFCLWCGSGHPGRGVPTGLTVGNGPVPFRRTHRNDRSTPANPHNLPTCHCEAAGRGDRRECLWCNLLRHCTNPHCLPGDCHVGLRPPRNDVVIFTWSFCLWCGPDTPGGVSLRAYQLGRTKNGPLRLQRPFFIS